jgi:N-dimethylarginine dimethylaminohydrolase
MHLLSLISLVDRDLAVVYLPLLAVETVELLRAEGVELLEITPEEFENLGCNILALGPRHCLVVAGNPRVRRELEKRRVRVEEFSDVELGLNMGGGPTCLVQAVLREF